MYHAIRELKENSTFGKGDVLVLFGELFQRGYANGLVEEAEARGMTIIRTTVGRREKDGSLRALTAEESALVPKPFINIPLEAGFDMEADSTGVTPVEQMKDIKLSNWEDFKFRPGSIEESRQNGITRFKSNLKKYVAELEKHLPPTANVLFAHLMAGGVPRAKIIMPLMNRSLKGTGERFLSSEKFWNLELGKVSSISFNEVTADTYNHLLQETQILREKIQAGGKKVSYIAYGYHGTEVLIGSNYVWQTYTPYLQGWAKMKLENYAKSWSGKGIATCVYNCPEILTNSSSIFQGVEVPLYPLLGALKKESGEKKHIQEFIKTQLDLLKPEHTLDEVLNLTKSLLTSDIIRTHCVFEKWPQHNGQQQLETILNASEQLIGMHKDPKVLLTFGLSELVFKACGQVMINDSPHPEAPTSWINHDIIAKIS